MVLKLADLRFAASERCPPFIHKEPLESISVGWMAPETMLRHIFSKETDVWAFGVLVSFPPLKVGGQFIKNNLYHFLSIINLTSGCDVSATVTPALPILTQIETAALSDCRFHSVH